MKPREITDTNGAERLARRHARVANRIASRAMGHVQEGENSFVAKGGLFGRLATSHEAEVYAIAAENLQAQGVEIKVERVVKREFEAPLFPIYYHGGDIVTVTSLKGSPIDVAPHPTLDTAHNSANSQVQTIFPPTE